MTQSSKNDSSSNAQKAAVAEPPGESLHALLDEFRAAIWKRRPILGEIMRKHGDKILHLYAKDFMDVNPTPGLDERKPELIAMVRALTALRLGEKVADDVSRQLTKFPLVSTTDHHGPIDHPFFVNANLISGIPYRERNDPDLQYLVVFSFASVSVNNASAYPRGILFHGGVGDSGNLIRLPILPDKLKMGVVYGTRAFTRDDLTKAEIELQKKEKIGEIAAGRGDRVRDLLETYFGDKDVLAAPDLNAQITIINHRLWPKLFHAPAAQPTAPDMRVPDLLYLEIETLVDHLFRSRHLNDKSSLMYRMLFDPEFMKHIPELFNGVPGAFSLEKGWGTYFFWAMDERKHRVRLMLRNGKLESEDAVYSFDWNADSIKAALAERKIFPSMLPCYLMVSLYYGMKCLGGFCQVNDLTVTKEAWATLMRRVGEEKEAEAVHPVQTKELGGDGMVLPYYPTPNGDFVPATGIDMVLHEGSTQFEKYAARSEQVTLSEMMNPMLPEIYSVLYAAPERDPRLLTVTPEQIARATGLTEKLVQGFTR